MPPIIDSIIVLAVTLIIARFIKRGSGLLQRLFIPSALVAGVGALLLGPQVFEAIPLEVTQYWAKFPKYLINIVFAGLFLGKIIPKRKEIWRQAGPMIAFGNTLAWGQYVIGIALAALILVPVFDANPIVGALIEVSFEGGHGTAAGLAPTFEQLGWSEGTDLALGLATVSILAAVFSGVILVNLRNRRHGYLTDQETWEKQRRQLIRSGYNLVNLSNKINTNPFDVVFVIFCFAVSIGLGWGMLEILIWSEDLLLNGVTDIRFFTYLPMFPLVMIGGLMVQMTLRAFNKQTLIKRRIVETFSIIALDALVASAIATVSLKVIGNNIEVFLILAIAGIAWILGCFVLLAPKMFPTFWFENGVTNVGQSMGMTATGLLLNRLIDPTNTSKARENFAYKQLVFEPFMGGGIVTAAAAIIIHEFGLDISFVVALIVTVFWLLLGLRLAHKHKKRLAAKS